MEHNTVMNGEAVSVWQVLPLRCMPTPTFDHWTTLFLFFTLQSVVVGAVLFLHRRGDRVANRLLGLLLLLFAVTLFDYELYWTHYNMVLPHLAGISSPLPFLFGPIILFYFLRVGEKRTIRVRDMWHLVPFLVHMIILLPWFMGSADEKRSIMLGEAHWPKWRMAYERVVPWAMIAHMAAYALVSFRSTRTSGLLKEMRRWAAGLLLCFCGFIAAYASYFSLVHLPFFSPDWDYMISLAMAAFITFVAVFGYVQPAVFNGFALADLKASLPTPERYRNSGLTISAAIELYDRLESVMRTERLYSTGDLRLEALAERLGTTKHNLSQVINERSGLNFFGYVNRFRVDEAKSLLATTTREELHVIEVAYQVGFNTKASFNSTFKKFTGSTPTEYRETVSR